MPFAAWVRIFALVVFALVVQIALLDQIVVSGVHPDVMIILPVAAGLSAGAQRGAAIGFVAGLFADLGVQLPYGLSALTFVLAGFVAGLVSRAATSSEATAAETLSCAVLSSATMALYVLIGTIIGQSGLLSSQTLSALAMVGGSALVLSYPVLRLTRRALRGAAAPYSVPSGGSALS